MNTLCMTTYMLCKATDTPNTRNGRAVAVAALTLVAAVPGAVAVTAAALIQAVVVVLVLVAGLTAAVVQIPAAALPRVKEY